jgi:26S proteasome regulatory subunit N2
LIAYQIAFDIEESAKQEYLQKLLQILPTVEDSPAATSDNSWMVIEKPEDPIQKIRLILSGQLSIKLYLEFLYRNNKADLLILKNTKNALDSRNSVFHSGVTFANAFMNAGTTSDEFLRQNLDWLSRASNWTKFSATAALGVIHKVSMMYGFTAGSYISGPHITITVSSTTWCIVVFLL